MTAASVPACARCGRHTQPLFPREPLGAVCATCYETVGRLRPEWSRLEILGIVGMLVGSALIAIAVIALLVR